MASVTALSIISDALTFGLNRLSPGETLDSDLANICLSALNNICDELNGVKTYLFREILTAGTVTSSVGTLGTTWAGLGAGDEILSATVRYGASEDVTIYPLTMAQYHGIGDKTTTGVPSMYAHDGSLSVYFYPVPSSSVVTLRTKAAVSDFADLATSYTMPAGYKSAFSALLAEKMAPSLNAVTPLIVQQARAARLRLGAQVANPAILGYQDSCGYSIYEG
jgi:hypothetical protein